LKLIEAYLSFKLMEMDILTNLNKMPDRYKHIIVLTDYYKWPKAFVVKDHLAKTLAQIIVKEIMSKHGAPERIITNRGQNFMSNVY